MKNIILLFLVVLLGCRKNKAFKPIILNKDIDNLLVNHKVNKNFKNWEFKDVLLDSVVGISLHRAYDSILNKKDSKSVVVALIDMTVEVNHLGLKNSIWVIIFLNSNQQKFKEEFHVNKRIKKELGFKYNDIIKNKIDKHHTTFLRKDYISNVIKSLKEINSNNEKKENLHRILSGLIHMSVNRLFSNNQRLYEMVIYDFLYKKSKTNFIRYGKI